MYTEQFPKTGLVRLDQIIAPYGPIPVCRSTWYQGIKEGRFPKQIDLGGRAAFWRAEEVRALYEKVD